MSLPSIVGFETFHLVVAFCSLLKKLRCVYISCDITLSSMLGGGGANFSLLDHRTLAPWSRKRCLLEALFLDRGFTWHQEPTETLKMTMKMYKAIDILLSCTNEWDLWCQICMARVTAPTNCDSCFKALKSHWQPAASCFPKSKTNESVCDACEPPYKSGWCCWLSS